MASKDHKIVRRAKAMTELGRLSGILAEHLNVEPLDINVANRDAELAEIQRIENINGLLGLLAEVLQNTKTANAEVTERSASKKTLKHGANK